MEVEFCIIRKPCRFGYLQIHTPKTDAGTGVVAWRLHISHKWSLGVVAEWRRLMEERAGGSGQDQDLRRVEGLLDNGRSRTQIERRRWPDTAVDAIDAARASRHIDNVGTKVTVDMRKLNRP